jgi:hypothetical protein
VSKEKLKKMRASALPPPMLSVAQWEAAAKIGGAYNIKELGLQFDLAVKGEFVVSLPPPRTINTHTHSDTHTHIHTHQGAGLILPLRASLVPFSPLPPIGSASPLTTTTSTTTPMTESELTDRERGW